MANGQTQSDFTPYKITKQELPVGIDVGEETQREAERRFQIGRGQETQEQLQKFQQGDISYQDYQDFLAKQKTRAVGAPEQREVGQAEAQGLNIERQREETEAAGRYDRGEITYDEYLNTLKGFQQRYVPDTPEYQRVQEQIGGLQEAKTQRTDNQWATDFAEGRVSYQQYSDYIGDRIAATGAGTAEFNELNEILKGAGVTQQQVADDAMLNKFQNNAISYDDYINYLSGRLDNTVEGTGKSNAYKAAWRNAYNDQLKILDDEMFQKEQSGVIGPEEYKAYLAWRSKKASQGYDTPLKAPTFTFTPKKKKTIAVEPGKKKTTKNKSTAKRTYLSDPATLGLYKEEDLIRSGGRIYLKPGVKSRTGLKVPGPDQLKGYSESDLVRVGGKIYLKPGVKKKW